MSQHPPADQSRFIPLSLQVALGTLFGLLVAIAAGSLLGELKDGLVARLIYYPYPFGLCFGLFALAPLALRLNHTFSRYFAALLYCHATYLIMVFWAILTVDKWWGIGELQGVLGAVLVIYGLARILQYLPRRRDLLWVLPLAAVAGRLIVNVGHGGLAGGTWALVLSHFGHLLWQAAVAAALVQAVRAARDPRDPAAVLHWSYRYSPALLPPVCLVAVLFIVFLGNK